MSLWRCLGLCKEGGEGLGESGYRCPFDRQDRGAEEGSPKKTKVQSSLGERLFLQFYT